MKRLYIMNTQSIFHTIFILFIFLKTTSAQIYSGEDVILCTPQDTNLTVEYILNSTYSTSNYLIESMDIDM